MGDRGVWLKWVWDRYDGFVNLNRVKDDDIRRFTGMVWRNAAEMSVQFIVGFRPLLGSCVASMVRELSSASQLKVSHGSRIPPAARWCFTDVAGSLDD
ncbi:hypothetical protein HAX54_013621, partial [Datura stramonium]|nr:hypothetical protein [Datura stramonium]